MSNKKSLFGLIENRTSEIVLMLLALLPCVQMIARSIFSTDIPGYDGVMRHLTLWTALIAGMICTKEKQHISLGFNENLAEGKLKSFIELMVTSIGSAFSIAIAIAAVSFSV